MFYVDSAGHPAAPPAGARVPAPGRTPLRERIGRRWLVAAGVGVVVLALALGGGFWWLNRQPTMAPDEAGNVFSPAIMGLTNNSYYGSIDGNGQYSGDEVRANLSRTKFHGDALNSCISAVKQKMTHVDMLQVLASSQRPTDHYLFGPAWGHSQSRTVLGAVLAFDSPRDAEDALGDLDYWKPCLTMNTAQNNSGATDETHDQGRKNGADWVALEMRTTFSTNGDALPTEGSSSSSGLATGGCLVRYGNTITLAARKAEDKGGAGSPSLSDIDCAGFAQRVSSRIDHLA